MPYKITQHEKINPHELAITIATCDLTNDNDLLLNTIVNLVRKSYGENAVMADAEVLMSKEIENGTFNLDHLRAAIRKGLPDPEQERNKPKQLTNYRSQSAEMVAKAALAKVYQYKYPAAPQEGTGNPNQPILGFDGWGILETEEGDNYLALIQVKATDNNNSPPPDADKLAEECRSAPKDKSKICRALTMLCRLTKGDPLHTSVMQMLEKMGQPSETPIIISPVIVRGLTCAKISDLDPVMFIANEILPAPIHALVVSIGVCLEQFGLRVMTMAREVI